MAQKESTKKESREDTYSYKGWLNSDKFLKRAFAIYGYMLVAGLIISIPFYIIFFIFILLFSLT